MTGPTEVLAAIGDPIRFEVLRLLLADEGLAQAALAERLGVTPSRLGNHLAALRASGLVEPVRVGRSTHYTLRNADAVRALVGAVYALADDPEASRADVTPGTPSPGVPSRGGESDDASAGSSAIRGGASRDGAGLFGSEGAGRGGGAALNGGGDERALPDRGGRRGPSAFARARTCYDHLAGEVGVQVLDRLMAEGALIPGPEAESVLRAGDTLEPALERLGVPYPQVGRRKLAVGCLDATAGREHLGGALGSEVLRSFLRRGLLLPGPAPRTLIEHPALQPLLA